MKSEGDSMAETEDDVLSWLFGKVGGPANAAKMPMCGSSVGFDRNFLRANMPALEDWFHYRSIDVSTIREIASMVNPRVVESAPEQMLVHRPYPDLIDSINLYKHFIEEFFFITDEDAPRVV
jgi:oligoribonuclease